MNEANQPQQQASIGSPAGLAAEMQTPGAAAAPERSVENFVQRVKEGLDQAFLQVIRPGSLAAAGVSLGYAIFNGIYQPTYVAVPVVSINIATSIICLAMFFLLRAGAIAPRYSHAAGAVIMLCFLAVNNVGFSLSGDPWRTTDLGIIILTIGCLSLSTLYFSLLIPACLLCWMAVAWHFMDPDELPKFVESLVALTVVAVIIHAGRMKNHWRTVTLHLMDEERKRDLEVALQQAQENEQRYRTLVENSPIGLLIHSDGKLLFANRRALELTGYSKPEDVVGRPVLEFVHPEDRPYAIKRIAELLKSRQTSQLSEIRLLRSDGNAIHAEITGSIVSYHGKLAIQTIFNDVTERFEAEEARRKSEAEYRSIVENATDSIFRLDRHGNYTYANPVAVRLLGYTQEEFLRMRFDQIIAPGYREQVRWAAVKQIRKRIPDLYDEFPVICKDGGEIWFGHNCQTIYEGKRLVGFQSVCRDITARIRAEQEKEKLEEKLRHSQKMDAIGTLAGGIAHDFNNLLSGILGYSNMLKSKTDPSNPDFKAISVIEKAAERAAHLTQQLLGFARKGKHQNIPVDLGAATQEVLELLSHSIDKRITIIERIPPNAPKVKGDPDQLKQVVLNLALNARDAMQDGGQLVLEIEPIRLTPKDCEGFDEARPGNYLLMKISDTGHGIPKEILDRIFEPFFTTKKQGKGTGMGLAMVYGIVQNHGGFIRVYSEESLGTSFNLYFPQADSSDEHLVDPLEQLEPTSGVGRVLVVDDEEVVRNLATDMLESLGYEVQTARDGLEAIELYRQYMNQIDLILLDMIMPRVGGKECFKALKEMNPSVKAVLSTGYSRDGAAQEILDQGMAGFIQKPYRISQLSEVIAQALQ